MIIRRSHERGRSYEEWLRSQHSFSFNHYYDPRFSGYGPIQVLNEDIVLPGGGFAAHAHRNVDIITYVLEGELTHEDSAGNSSVIKAGEFQLMSAGTGIVHSELNSSSEHPVHFLQIWIAPDQRGHAPTYQQRAFPQADRRGKLRLVASRDGAEGSLTFHQDMKLFVGLFDEAEQHSFNLVAGRRAWLQVARGELSLNGVTLRAGDGFAPGEERLLQVQGIRDSEILLFDLPPPGE